MNNSKGNLLLIASAVLIISGVLAYNSNSGTGQGPNPTENESGGSTEPTSQPSCKKCGARMELKTNFKTKKRFWGCSTYQKSKCNYTEDYLGGPVPPLRNSTKSSSSPNFLTSNLKNASVIRYHLKQYRNPQFWSHQVHENLKEVMPNSTLHSFNRTEGYDSAPDMILSSKKSGRKRAYEYQYGKNYTYFEISESRYSVMSTGGAPLDGNDRINPSFVPKEIFVMHIDQIKAGNRYHIDDAFREKYSFLKHINWVETD